jgi:hypothetical protein
VRTVTKAPAFPAVPAGVKPTLDKGAAVSEVASSVIARSDRYIPRLLLVPPTATAFTSANTFTPSGVLSVEEIAEVPGLVVFTSRTEAFHRK